MALYTYDNSKNIAGFILLFGGIFVLFTIGLSIRYNERESLILDSMAVILLVIVLFFGRWFSKSKRLEFYNDHIRIFEDETPIDVGYRNMKTEWKNDLNGMAYCRLLIPANTTGSEKIVRRKMWDGKIKKLDLTLSEFLHAKIVLAQR